MECGRQENSHQWQCHHRPWRQTSSAVVYQLLRRVPLLLWVTKAWKSLPNFRTGQTRSIGPPVGQKHALCSWCPPGDRRPLTVMNACCRIWARNLAIALLKCLNSWAHPSLVGSRKGFNADATALEVAEIINRARVGERGHLSKSSSLDQSKFFDRLSQRAGLQQAEHILEVYSSLGGQLWIGAPPAHSRKVRTRVGSRCPMA